jgi:hypothetical protein
VEREADGTEGSAMAPAREPGIELVLWSISAVITK